MQTKDTKNYNYYVDVGSTQNTPRKEQHNIVVACMQLLCSNILRHTGHHFSNPAAYQCSLVSVSSGTIQSERAHPPTHPTPRPPSSVRARKQPRASCNKWRRPTAWSQSSSGTIHRTHRSTTNPDPFREPGSCRKIKTKSSDHHPKGRYVCRWMDWMADVVHLYQTGSIKPPSIMSLGTSILVSVCDLVLCVVETGARCLHSVCDKTLPTREHNITDGTYRTLLERHSSCRLCPPSLSPTQNTARILSLAHPRPGFLILPPTAEAHADVAKSGSS